MKCTFWFYTFKSSFNSLTLLFQNVKKNLLFFFFLTYQKFSVTFRVYLKYTANSIKNSRLFFLNLNHKGLLNTANPRCQCLADENGAGPLKGNSILKCVKKKLFTGVSLLYTQPNDSIIKNGTGSV